MKIKTTQTLLLTFFALLLIPFQSALAGSFLPFLSSSSLSATIGFQHLFWLGYFILGFWLSLHSGAIRFTALFACLLGVLTIKSLHSFGFGIPYSYYLPFIMFLTLGILILLSIDMADWIEAIIAFLAGTIYAIKHVPGSSGLGGFVLTYLTFSFFVCLFTFAGSGFQITLRKDFSENTVKFVGIALSVFSLFCLFF